MPPSSPEIVGESMAVAIPDDLREICFAIPAIKALKRTYSSLNLVAVCEEKLTPILEDVSEVTQIVAYPERASERKITNILKESEQSFDASIVWDNQPLAKAFRRFAIPQRIGYDSSPLNETLTSAFPPQNLKTAPQHRVRHYCHLVDQLGCHPYQGENFPVISQTSDKNHLLVILESDLGRHATWETERFLEVLTQLLEKFPTLKISVIRPSLSKNFSPNSNDRLTVIDPPKDLSEMLPLIRDSSALLASDHGFVHLAAHLGIPTITIFGPNSKVWKRPLGTFHQVLQADVECAPCLLKKCPLDNRCLSALSVEKVIASLQEVLV